MKAQREARRRRAGEVRQQRLDEAKEAEGRGGIEAVDFLRKIREYDNEHGLAKPPVGWAQGGGGSVWDADTGSRIRVCVRKRPMLRTEVLRHDFDVISTEPGGRSLVVHEPRTKAAAAAAWLHRGEACGGETWSALVGGPLQGGHRSPLRL